MNNESMFNKKVNAMGKGLHWIDLDHGGRRVVKNADFPEWGNGILWELAEQMGSVSTSDSLHRWARHLLISWGDYAYDGETAKEMLADISPDATYHDLTEWLMDDGVHSEMVNEMMGENHYTNLFTAIADGQTQYIRELGEHLISLLDDGEPMVLGQEYKGGTLSKGTMVKSELIDAFLSFLQNEWGEKYAELADDYEDILEGDYNDDEDVNWLLDDLFDALGDIAPEGCYFGGHWGDSAMFGFWVSEMETEGE